VVVINTKPYLVTVYGLYARAVHFCELELHEG
jgi:hypothetical protein